MIATLLESSKSARTALDYNEKKMAEGNASIPAYRNLPGDDYISILRAFQARENDLRVPQRVRKKSFHMAVSPDATDDVYGDDERAVELIDRLMEGLGYADQPYVIYKHKDIEREHYHVVSTRILPDGHVISDAFDMVKMLSMLRSMEQEFGYVTGRRQELKRGNEQYDSVRPEDTDKVERMRDCVKEAMEYDFASLTQLNLILAQMGVKAHRSRRDKEREAYWFSVVGSHAVAVSEKKLGVKVGAALERGRKKDVDARLKIKLEVIMTCCAEKAKTWEQFKKMMSECGLVFDMDEKAGKCVTYHVMDGVQKVVVNQADLGRDCSAASLNANGWPLGEKVSELMLTEDDKAQMRRLISARIKALSAGKKKEEKDESQTQGVTRTSRR